MMFGQLLNSHRIFKRLAKALIRLRVCAARSEPLLVAYTTLLEIPCHGSIILKMIETLLSEKIRHHRKFNKVLIFFSYSDPSGKFGSDGKQNTA